MAKVDFFDSKYLKGIHSESQFGLCDDGDSRPAYVNLDKKAPWVASVLNENTRSVRFIPVDNNIFHYRNGKDKERSCDVLLAYDGRLIFVELKNKRKGYISDGLAQLLATINRFKQSHNLDNYSSVRAFVANRRHPNVSTSSNVRVKQFFIDTGVQVQVKSNIEII